MADIIDYIKVYIEESDILEEKAEEVALDLTANIKDEAPYDQGRLRRSIRADTRELSKNSVLVTGYFDEGLAPHGIYVLGGSKKVEGTPMKMPWGYRMSRRAIPPNDFLGRGLDRTLENYK